MHIYARTYRPARLTDLIIHTQSHAYAGICEYHVYSQSEDAIRDVVIYVVHLFFFFFQAEDGIRDIGVTGVQTCALPIFPLQVVFSLWTTRLVLQAIGPGFTGAYRFAWGFGFFQMLFEFGISSALQRQDRKSVV